MVHIPNPGGGRRGRREVGIELIFFGRITNAPHEQAVFALSRLRSAYAPSVFHTFLYGIEGAVLIGASNA